MKNLIALVSILMLASCGFTPIYGSQSGAKSGVAATKGLDNVDIDIIPNAEGVALRNALIDRFYANGYPSNPRYRLSVAPIIEDVIDFDITVESETTSRQLKLSTILGLMDLQTGEVVLKRKIQAYASYNVIGSQFTTRVSEADSREAAINDLARQIETQLSLYFNR